ncbi:hypothetical protein HELRODRAFT_183886 [Helobdella robusta]|uniref:Transmembrane protein 164 n=1 Tax=Helobdella robusta TaxID=6412 RepID=T1FKA4_HELRO|nr:hypothetical protein HELRODRAFT_183886 [Helobdella robusta]ESO09742.1 hypothetical protein HELRODRAFT_183886 [Helobdella robusta]
MLAWTYSGVNFSIPGTGGPECVDYLSSRQKILETFLVLLVSSLQIWYMMPCLGPRKVLNNNDQNGVVNDHSQLTDVSIKNYSPPLLKQILLLLLSLVFGIELGFKLSTRQFIWILNPCHVVTIIQIYLLIAPASKLSSLMFRFHIHMLSGVSIAICFPVVNTRLLEFEVATYWAQHLLLLFIPFYLMSLGGAYSVEDFADMTWSVFALSIQMIYHFIFLQPISLVTGINLNNIMCPAVSDPFKGTYYRLYALLHQSLLIIIHGKAYVFLAYLFHVPLTFSKYPYIPVDKI